MLRVFQNELLDGKPFVITLELVPGKASTGRSIDTVMGIARDSFADGRISAVSITDNPGGNPALSPDVIGSEIFKVGMDVIVHFTCRDLNRVGMESRALQLAMMGMKNLLLLTGDYTGKGFGGQGAPVFDLDSVNLTLMLAKLNERIATDGDPDGFFTGCAVSPFKQTAAEGYAQYAKLCRKVAAGARFAITQIGYDARKFAELVRMSTQNNNRIPLIGSVYVLTPRAAAAMNRGDVPGAVVTDRLLRTVEKEWQGPKQGRKLAIERAARLGVVLKGLGYRGMHIGGIHRRFDTVGAIVDRMQTLEPHWQSFLPEFDFPMPDGFYLFPKDGAGTSRPDRAVHPPCKPLALAENLRYRFLKATHALFFSFDTPGAPVYGKICRWIDRHPSVSRTVGHVELAVKRWMLDCQHCGDCGIQHLAFLCPESQCPKHTRNGPCGGSRHGRCEVYPERVCVWVRVYDRLAALGDIAQMHAGCIPPRMWELNRTPSWLNFHLHRDHQSSSCELAQACRTVDCRIFDLPDRSAGGH